jgi:acyl-CoA dehydrogenase
VVITLNRAEDAARHSGNGHDAPIGASRTRASAFDLSSRIKAAVAVARANADAVDHHARFPAEAFDAAREYRLLGMMVPVALGGEGASVSDVADVCYSLARSCASTAMIFAMHQIMVAILIRHGQSSPWHIELLRRLADEQLLFASSTTDGQGGGDLRASSCAVELDGSGIKLTKSATVMSYGAHADAVLTTARRSIDAAPSDQVIVAFTKDGYELEPIRAWDTLGMRGTCSAGFTLKGRGVREQVVPEHFQTIQSRTMMPVAHLTWSAVWCGIAAEAVERARRCVRAAARRTASSHPPAGVTHLTRTIMSLGVLTSALKSALQKFESASEADGELDSLDSQNAMNLLKVTASEMATSVVVGAMQACGLAGYRNDGEFSVSRNLRDVLSSSIMINNDRIIANSGAASFLANIPASLRS